MRIYPAIHYTMGGLWVDYNLMSSIDGLFVGGEANFSDHGANRLGASALMQGLADGYFVLPVTVASYLASQKAGAVDDNHAAVKQTVAEVTERVGRLVEAKGKRSPDSYHPELGARVCDHCGMARGAAGLKSALGKWGELREQCQ